MNFPRDYHCKRRMNVPPLTHNTKTALLHHQNLLPAKGVVTIEQYQYQEENLLGVGYSSRVYLGYLAEDTRQTYAIKVVDKRKMGKDKQNLALLKQEMEIHQQLDHPNIVKCHQIIDHPTHYYFILEYCPHGSLDAFIKNHQTLTETATLPIMHQILSAYRYLIDQKVLHRDLKPANILRSGSQWKICDFGFSVKGKKNLVGEINVGTPAYMAPQALQRSFYSHKTDFFSLGVICYQMLFGVTPWQHNNQKVLLSIMREGQINNLALIHSQTLRQFILRCCDPLERTRISLHDFSSFNFANIDDYPPTSFNRRQTKQVGECEFRPSAKSFYALRQHRSQETFDSQNTTISTVKAFKKEPIEQLFNGNNNVIERQLQICWVLNALIANYGLLGLDQNERQLYLVVLGKHAGHIIRRIKHSKLNYLCLKRWEQYIQSPQYLSLASEASQIQHRIESFMNGEVKRKSMTLIREIGKKFDDLTYDKHLTPKCLSNLKQYIMHIMKDQLKKQEQINREGSTQMLPYLLKYYNYIKSICVSSEQSRIIAIEHDFKQRHLIVEDFNQPLQTGHLDLLRQEITTQL